MQCRVIWGIFKVRIKEHIKKWIALAAASAVLAAGALPAAAAPPGSSLYVFDNGGFGLPARAFEAELHLQTGQRIELSDGNGPVPDDALISTGQTLTVRNLDGGLVLEQKVSVRGDVAGTGKIGLVQLVNMAGALKDAAAWEPERLEAADLTESGKIELSDLVAAARQLASAMREDTETLETEVVDAYFRTPDVKEPMPLYFADEAHEIPYISTKTIWTAVRALLGIVEADDITEKETEPGVIVYERENGSAVEMDFNEGTITFTNFNTFLQGPYVSSILDVLNTSGLTKDGDPWFFARSGNAFQREGLPVVVNLHDRGIRTYYLGRTGYIPLQTFSDLFMVPFGFQILYNGQMVGIIAGGEPGPLSDQYYSAEPQMRSGALADFSYNELCLMMDMYYGLKEQHDIEDFDSFFQQTGIKEQLKSTDPVRSGNALYEMAYGYLADMHTAVLNPSYFAGADAHIYSYNTAPGIAEYETTAARFAQAREKAYPNGVPGYEEIGDTAFVTIDSLTWFGYDYYSNPPGPDAEDTIGLICYAHSQIMREGSPIRNVVLDLSANEGGLADAAIFVLAWFQGTAQIDLNDTLTQAQASTRYQADVNLDWEFTADDSVVSLNRYCLISPVSFSCGNLIPAVLKADPTVIVAGQESRGGACLVWPVTTADGTMMQISGPLRESTITNGSFYDIDRGVAPDFTIADPDRFYDREELSAYLTGLFR